MPSQQVVSESKKLRGAGPTSRSPAKRPTRRTYYARRLIVVAAALIAVWICAWALDSLVHIGGIGRNVYVNDVALSGMSREDATQAVAEQADGLEADPILIRANETELSLAPEQLGVSIDVTDEVDAAIAARNKWNPVGWLWSVAVPKRIEYKAFDVDRAKLEAELRPPFAGLEEPAVDAHWEPDAENDGITATLLPSELGQGLDIDRAQADIEKAMLRSGEKRRVDVPLAVLKPDLTTEAASKLGIKDRVGTFTTSFVAGQARVENIARISEVVSGAIIDPGGTFSINDYVGERTLEAGFVEAPVIDSGRYEDDVGGGVSQFATTMFNAAFFAGIKIPEFKPHSLYISRYPLGREATLAYPNIDLVIENDYESHLLVRSEVGPSSMTVTFYGTADGRTVETSTGERTDPTDPEIDCKLDSEVKPGSEEIVQSPASGFSVEITRIVKWPDDLEDEWTFTTVYKPKNRVIAYSPAPPRVVPTSSIRLQVSEPDDPGATGPEAPAIEGPVEPAPAEGETDAETPSSTTTTKPAPPRPSLKCPGIDGNSIN